MKRLTWVAGAVLVIGLVAGCGPKKQPAEELSTACVPYEIAAEVNDGLITVLFKSECASLISGYNIYLSKEPLVEKYPGMDLPAFIEPHNHPVFAGDTNPEDGIEHYDAERIENGVTYYIHVRTMFADRTLSKPSPEIAVVAGPRGQFDLSIRYKSEQDGFSFAQNGYVRADGEPNDLYFYAKDGQDYLASPDRLGFLRTTRFRTLPYKGDLAGITSRLSAEPLPSDDRVRVKKGDWVEVMTADKTFALIKVVDIVGDGDDRRLRLQYAFSPAVGAPLF